MQKQIFLQTKQSMKLALSSCIWFVFIGNIRICVTFVECVLVYILTIPYGSNCRYVPLFNWRYHRTGSYKKEQEIIIFQLLVML